MTADAVYLSGGLFGRAPDSVTAFFFFFSPPESCHSRCKMQVFSFLFCDSLERVFSQCSLSVNHNSHWPTQWREVLVETIDKGSCGKVMLEKSDNVVFARKSPRKEKVMSRDHVEHTKTERDVL